jgi:hypothetical protein
MFDPLTGGTHLSGRTKDPAEMDLALILGRDKDFFISVSA